MKYILLTIWFAVVMLVLTKGLNMISANNTIENIIGLFMIVIFSLISLKTKCFTYINLKKNEKDN